MPRCRAGWRGKPPSPICDRPLATSLSRSDAEEEMSAYADICHSQDLGAAWHIKSERTTVTLWQARDRLVGAAAVAQSIGGLGPQGPRVR